MYNAYKVICIISCLASSLTDGWIFNLGAKSNGQQTDDKAIYVTFSQGL